MQRKLFSKTKITSRNVGYTVVVAHLFDRILGVELVHEDGQDSLNGLHVEVQEGLIVCDGVDDALHIQLTQLS